MRSESLTPRSATSVPSLCKLDELWAMVGCHGKNVTVDSPADWGDAWMWLALDSESKMILSYHIGPRNTVSAWTFFARSERTDARHLPDYERCAAGLCRGNRRMVWCRCAFRSVAKDLRSHGGRPRMVRRRQQSQCGSSETHH